MPNITSLEMLLRSLIVALPLLVLIVLFFLLASRLRHRSQVPSKTQAPPSEVAAEAVQEASRPVQPAARTTADASTAAAAAASASGDTQVAEAPPQASQAAVIAAIESEIARAEAAEATVELAELYLSLGRAHMADGAEGEALSALRSAAGLAALHKAPKVHALARLELAEVAISHGDPTTACEHWQMARMAFLDAGSRVEGDKIDRRMRAQGCPTDWVLTDF